MRIITNSNKPHDRMKPILLDQAQSGTEIKIASAFFTSFEVLEKMASNETEIKMIVRLGFGTSPSELKKALGLKNVSIRVFTGTRFHPKFYIFGTRVAYLGSSNLTGSGLMENQEINIEIEGDEPVFSELEDAFIEYWNAAHPLEIEDVEKFASIVKNIEKPDPSNLIKTKIGDYQFNNTGLEKSRSDGLSDFIESFKREYQIFLKKHKELEEMYVEVGLRRYPYVPLRIEIDRFIWWIRERYAKTDAVQNAPLRNSSEIKEIILPLVHEFHVYKNDFLEQSTEPRFKVLNNVFATTRSINTTPIRELVDALQYVYSFHDYYVRYVGQWNDIETNFIALNGEQKIKHTLNYLLHGKDPYQERIYRCWKDNNYTLKYFGINSYTELFGLVNNEDIPILNSRTRNSMQWLGFGKI
jgi:HKD family nuclease